MTLIDWVIIGIIAISALISIKRGFVKEALSLVSWVLAFLIAKGFSANLAVLLESVVDTPSARWGVAFGLLFAATLILGAMINHLVAEFVRLTGLTSMDRFFGMVFGTARGLILVTAVVYGLQFTKVTMDPWWNESMLIEEFELLAGWAKDVLPGATSTILNMDI